MKRNYDRSNYVYATPRWRELRKRILNRANGICEKCNRAYNSLLVHHVKPMREGGDYFPSEDKLLAVCQSCHSKLHAHDDKKFSTRHFERLEHDKEYREQWQWKQYIKQIQKRRKQHGT